MEQLKSWPNLASEFYYLYYHKMFFKQPILNKEYLELSKYIKKYVNMDDKILELGCGNGRTLFKLNNVANKIHGIDNSPLILSMLRKKIDDNVQLKTKVNIINSDMVSYSSNLKYDLIYTSSLCHVLDESQIEQLIINTYENLDVGGKFIITNPILKNKQNQSNLQIIKLDKNNNRKIKFINKSYIEFGKRIRHNIYEFYIYDLENNFIRKDEVRYEYRFFENMAIINLIEKHGFKFINKYLNEVYHKEKDMMIDETFLLFEKE